MELEIKKAKKEDGSEGFVIDMAKLEEAINSKQIDLIRAQTKEAIEIEKKAIWDQSDGRIFEKGESVVDMTWMQRKHSGNYQTPNPLGSSRMRQVSSGPFITLSPAMEKFAQCVKCGFDANFMNARGLSLSDYNKEVAEWNKKTTLSGGLSTTDAGALVPIEFLATVIEFAIEDSKILPKLWRIPMGSQTLRIPKLSQSAGSYFGGIVLYHPDELEEKTTTKPTFTYKEFRPKKTIGLIPLSDELIGDSTINIVNYLTQLTVRAVRYKTEGEVISGTGLNDQMQGIVTDASVNLVSRLTHGTVKFDDFINLESALDENFQDLTYVTRRKTFNTLRLQKATTGQPVWWYTWPMGGGGAQFDEYPVVKTRNMPAIGEKGDVMLGDLGYYIWTMRQDMTIDMSKERYFEYDATALRFVVRQDGAPAVDIAFAILNSTPQS